MSVIDKVKRKVGLQEQNPQYECDDCGRRFRSATEEGSYWHSCPDCGSEELTKTESV